MSVSNYSCVCLEDCCTLRLDVLLMFVITNILDLWKLHLTKYIQCKIQEISEEENSINA